MQSSKNSKVQKPHSSGTTRITMCRRVIPVSFSAYLVPHHHDSAQHCVSTPCLSSARDGYWFNTTDPKKSCKLPQPIELAFREKPTGGVGATSFMSLSLQASSFKGSCRLEMCGAKTTDPKIWDGFQDGIPASVLGSYSVSVTDAPDVPAPIDTGFKYIDSALSLSSSSGWVWFILGLLAIPLAFVIFYCARGFARRGRESQTALRF